MPKIKDLSTIEKEDGNLILNYDKTTGMFINLFYTKNNLSNLNERTKLIKKTESIIRKSARYRLYKNKLFEMGINMCAVLGNVTEDIATLEMHHGPIFTLWDYIEITIDYFYQNKMPINSFRLAQQVLNDHFEDLIQVVMISKSVHKAAHNGNTNNTFKIGLDSAWGNLVGYLEKYKGCLSRKHFAKLNEYFELKNKNTDENLFKLKITEWKNKKISFTTIPRIEEIRQKK